ncbi:MAG: hypothetical protein FD149_1840 [Rhodospirillaceae bacterium]|nr:MAG: hypothetical protein FD149_1840 [Rhodospirillaceae bacterium]
MDNPKGCSNEEKAVIPKVFDCDVSRCVFFLEYVESSDTLDVLELWNV